MKIVKVKLSANKVSKELESKQIIESFRKKAEILKQNIHYGDPIAKSKFTKKLKAKYGISNLFRVQLANYWRFLYTLTQGSANEIVVFVLDILDHKEYNKLFG